ncbi:MAG TPA: HEAT repeat domain-containing protein [Anaerolineales bacterium]|nr:HEAT repeat domain-containing protein [Anaerolineales bacterium]
MNWLTVGKSNEARRWISQLGDVSKRDRAAQELIRLGAEAATALIEALQTQDLGLLPVYQHILARIPAASPALIRALAISHPLVRGRVADVFSISKDGNAVPALLEALSGEYYTVRARAALALGQIGDKSAIPPLIRALKDHEDEVRMAACTAVGLFKDPSTFDDLANILLDDPKIEVRQAAVKALGDSRDSAAISFLLEALRDSFWWFEREQSVHDLLAALENMGTAIVKPLIESLSDREGTVRKFSAIVLGNLRDVRAVEELGMTLYDLHHEVSRCAAEALGKIGQPGFDILREALHHPEVGVREHAVLGLGMLNDERIVPLLAEMLNDPDKIVKKQAVLSLGNFKVDRSRQALEELAVNRVDRELSSLAKQVLVNFDQ